MSITDDICKPRQLHTWLRKGGVHITLFFFFWPLFFSPYKNACSSSTCFHNGTCLIGFTVKGYLCICSRYFKGENCELGKAANCLHCKLAWVMHLKYHTVIVVFSTQQIEVKTLYLLLFYISISKFNCVNLRYFHLNPLSFAPSVPPKTCKELMENKL